MIAFLQPHFTDPLSHSSASLQNNYVGFFGRQGKAGVGPFANYFFEIGKGQFSVQGGLWGPSQEKPAISRRQIVDNAEQDRNLKAVVSSKEFVDMFGPLREKLEKKKGKKSKGEAVELKKINMWGSQVLLKVPPKGFNLDHPEIEWLKLKSFWVGK